MCSQEVAPEGKRCHWILFLNVSTTLEAKVC